MLEDNREILLVQSTKTGEVLYEIRMGDKHIPKTFYENWVAYFKDTEHEAWNPGKYVKIIGGGASALYDLNLTASEASLMWLFIPYVRWDKNDIAHLNGKPITNKWILAHTDMSERSVYRAVKGLKDKGIIATADKRMFFNPYLIFRGRRIATELKDMFADSVIRRICEEKIIEYNSKIERYREYAKPQKRKLK